MTPQKRTALRAKLQKKLDLLQAKKDEAKRLSMDISALQGEVLETLDDIGLASFTYEDDEGFNVKATRVQATSLVFDQPKLKKTLGAAKWNKVTVRVLDTSLLEDAIAEGRIDPVDVASCSSEKKNKPYVKISRKLAKKDQSETHVKPEKPTKAAVGRRRGIR